MNPLVLSLLAGLSCSVALAQEAAPQDAAQPLQPLIDATPEGGVLAPPPGVYSGPARIEKPMTLDGGGKLVLDGQGRDTILSLKGSHIVVQGLRLRGSGHRHENLDACLRLEQARSNVVKDNDFSGCLVGIDLRHADQNIIRRNRITGSDPQFDMRGDGLRVWYSNDNVIEGNVITDHRDVLVEYSTRNVLRGNRVVRGRYGTHFMYASGNTAEGNDYSYNTVGLFSMYSNQLKLIGNRISLSNGAAGMGIGLKEASGVLVENNVVLNNAIGLYNDDSPFDPDDTNVYRGNTFAFNGIGVQFHRNQESNVFVGNDFTGNFTDVSARGGNGVTNAEWDGNYWDAYQGFDRKSAGIGETPFEIYAYADKIWSDAPMTSFFRGSPALESIDFLSRLAPFSKPQLVLRDRRPATRPFHADQSTGG
jgi:nitrous oxidase accessory protein